jgi:hypothetical protein
VKMGLPGSVLPSNKWLLILLVITLGLTAWTALRSDDAKDNNAIELVDKNAQSRFEKPIALKAAEKPKDAIKVSNPNNLIPWHKLKRELIQNKTYDLFKVHSWVVVPPVKKVKPAPPPAPVAPPAPFIYMGKLEDTPKNTQIFMMANGRLYSTRQGEKIDQQWRLDAEDANTLRLTYLPLNLPQVLSKSAKQPTLASAPIPTAELNP